VLFSKNTQFTGQGDQNKSACTVLSGHGVLKMSQLQSGNIKTTTLDEILETRTGVGDRAGVYGDNLVHTLETADPQIFTRIQMTRPTHVDKQLGNLGVYQSGVRNQAVISKLSTNLQDLKKQKCAGMVLTYQGYSMSVTKTIDGKFVIFDPHGSVGLFTHTNGGKAYAAVYDNYEEMIEGLSQRPDLYSGLTDQDMRGYSEWFRMAYSQISINTFYKNQ